MLDRTASWSSSTNEKRSWLSGKLVVVSAALVIEGGAELGGLFGRGVGAVISPARAAPGQSYHTHRVQDRTGCTNKLLSQSFLFLCVVATFARLILDLCIYGNACI